MGSYISRALWRKGLPPLTQKDDSAELKEQRAFEEWIEEQRKKLERKWTLQTIEEHMTDADRRLAAPLPQRPPPTNAAQNPSFEHQPPCQIHPDLLRALELQFPDIKPKTPPPPPQPQPQPQVQLLWNGNVPQLVLVPPTTTTTTITTTTTTASPPLLCSTTLCSLSPQSPPLSCSLSHAATPSTSTTTCTPRTLHGTNPTRRRRQFERLPLPSPIQATPPTPPTIAPSPAAIETISPRSLRSRRLARLRLLRRQRFKRPPPPSPTQTASPPPSPTPALSSPRPHHALLEHFERADLPASE